MNRPLKPRPPCQGCGHRSGTCHANCAEYKIFAERNETFRRWRNRERNIDMALAEMTAAHIMAVSPYNTKVGASGGMVKI